MQKSKSPSYKRRYDKEINFKKFRGIIALGYQNFNKF